MLTSIARAPARFDLGAIAERLRPALERAGVERAIAFGSYARGTQDGYSDLDLALVLETDLPRLERHGSLHELFDVSPVGLDLLVYTPQEFEAGRASGYDLFDAIAREGVTIHERRPASR